MNAERSLAGDWRSEFNLNIGNGQRRRRWRPFAAALAPVALALFAAASAAPTAGRANDPSIPATACNVSLNVIDKDPKGLNVRSTPQVLANNVRTVIAHADWTEVHVVGETGDWYQIDRFQSFNDGAEDGDPQDLPGGRRGWVHKSTLGDVRAFHGSMLYAEPNARGKYLVKFTDEDDITVLGCKGDWLKARAHGATGWIHDICTNERTTCV